MFIFPFYISLFFFMLGLFQVVSAFADLKDSLLWYEKAMEQEFQIEHCASIKATSLNLENAYIYLTRSIPERKEKFNQVKIKYQNFLEPFMRQENCSGEPFFSLTAVPYQEENRKIAKFWPNWTIHYE